jgi:hypothetical protein
MIKRTRNIARLAAATTALAVGLGLAAFGGAGSANAAVCWEQYSDGTYFWYYC